MDKIQRIREEIEKRFIENELNYKAGDETELHRMVEDKAIISFIDSMQEESVSEDLEEATNKHLREKGYLLTTNNGEHLAEVEAKGLFKAGSEWKEQQMMKEAVSATIVSDLDPHGADYGNQKIICGWGELEAKKFKNGSKVKLIIIKED